MQGRDDRPVFPLTAQESKVFNDLIEPADFEEVSLIDLAPAAIAAANNFEAYFEQEVLHEPHIPPLHRYLATCSFFMGCISSMVNYFLGEECALILTAPAGLASAFGVGAAMPSMALEGNALRDNTLHLLDRLKKTVHLPKKNNQKALRILAKGYVYISNLALGVLAVFIHMHFLKVPKPLKLTLLPGNFISNSVVNLQPFSHAMEDFFAYYNPGKTELTQTKRTILQSALSNALEKIRCYNLNEFRAFYQEMIAPMDTAAEVKSRWEKLLSLDDQYHILTLKKSLLTQFAGGCGWVFSGLCTLVNISICFKASNFYAKKLDISKEDHQTFFETMGLILSILCCSSYGVLCARPTQKIFEAMTTICQKKSPGWQDELPHQNLRRFANLLSPIFGQLTASLVAFWPLYYAHNEGEQSLSFFAFTATAPLFTQEMSKLINLGINEYDRYHGNVEPSHFLAFSAELDNIARGVSLLSDEAVDGLLPTTHPLFQRYSLNMSGNAASASSQVPLNSGSKKSIVEMVSL